MNGSFDTRRREQGAILIMYAFMLMLMLGVAGFALDLGLAYFRKAQLQAAADTIALAAAKALDGTTAGLTKADDVARTTAEGTAIALTGVLEWEPAALRFASSPDAPESEWMTGGAAAGAPAAILYARVDISKLGADMRVIRPTFIRALGVTGDIDIAPVAVAGPTALKVTPLAICALSKDAVAKRDHASPVASELITYGFRHGVTYDLLNLNPTPDASEGAYYLVDPLARAGTGPDGEPEAASGMNDDASANSIVGPFMCAGKLAYTNTGGLLRVYRPTAFGLARQINSRLDDYSGDACTRAGGPPDTNVKTYEGASAKWHSTAPAAPSALTVKGEGGPMSTVADRAPVAGQAVSAGNFGILWAYGPARKFAGGSFATSDWPKLYRADTTAKTTGTTWPAAGAYGAGGTHYGRAPAVMAFEPARKERRILRVPLLDCSTAVPGSVASATVLAYGRFFLPAPATDSAVPGEFAGAEALGSEPSWKTDVEVFR